MRKFLTNLSSLHKTRSVDHLTVLVLDLVGAVEFLIEKAVATESIAQLHVNNAPWSQNSLLVGIMELCKDFGNLVDAILDA